MSAKKQTEISVWDNPTESVKTLEQVKCWMLEGQSIVDIVEALHGKGVSKNQIKELVLKAQEEWAKMGGVDQDQLKGFARAGLMHIYKKMVEIGDYANAARTLKDLSKL